MRKFPAVVRLFALLLLLPATGCLLRSHRVEHAPLSDFVLQSASATELVDLINQQATGIKSLSATVDIATSVGGSKTGKVTEYQEIRGYILVRQPELLRMTGLLPVVRTRAFDMVSNGAQFSLYIPQKSKVYVGKNDLESNGGTGLIAMRPQIIYNALLLNDIDPHDDIAVVESGQEVVTDSRSNKKVPQPDYRLDVLHHGANGWFLERKIYFSRSDLKPRRLRVYDTKGDIVSNIQYDQWKQYGSLWFPSVVEIERPVEEYRITIGLVKLDLNQPLTDKQFDLAPPEGTPVVPVGNGKTNGKTSAPPSNPAARVE